LGEEAVQGKSAGELAAAVEAFLAQLRHNRNTERTYRAALAELLRFLSSQSSASVGDLRLGDIDETVLEGFRLYLEDHGRSAFTVRTYLAALSSFLSFLLTHELLPPGFSVEKARARLRRPQRGTPYPAPTPDPGLPLIIQYYDTLALPSGEGRANHLARLRILRARAIVHTLYSTAGRIAEVASLDRKHVADGRQSEVVITGKGGKQRLIFLTEEARRAIAAYVKARADTYQPLFISHGRDYGHRLTAARLWAIVKEGAKAVGIEVTPHDFRHYRARQMLNEGAPLEAIQEILGHADISTTRKVYAIYARPAVRQIFEEATLSPAEALRRWRSAWAAAPAQDDAAG
jgi:integrase/recombinase XerD